MFQGFTEDTYRFFWELAFDNSRSFMDANRERYRTVVYDPMRALSDCLTPVVQDIDGRLSTRYSQVISRINRDTRYAKDKSPYRDHAWLGYRLPGVRTGAAFVLYAEFERESYGYGMGMYAPNTELMHDIRSQILARPNSFLELTQSKAFASRFALQGTAFKRSHYPDEPEELQRYLNMRNISFCFSSNDLQRTLKPAIADEIAQGFAILKPVYRLIMGLG